MASIDNISVTVSSIEDVSYYRSAEEERQANEVIRIAQEEARQAYFEEIKTRIDNGEIGDMSKVVYDTNDSGTVDDAEQFRGEDPAFYLDCNNFTNRYYFEGSDEIVIEEATEEMEEVEE